MGFLTGVPLYKFVPYLPLLVAINPSIVGRVVNCRIRCFNRFDFLRGRFRDLPSITLGVRLALGERRGQNS